VGRLRILQTIHDFLPRHRAGSEIYAAELCRELTRRHHVTLLCAEYDPARAHGHLTWRVHDGLPVVEMVNNWVCRSFADGYRSPELTARIGQVMDAVEPDIVHAQSFLNLSFDLVDLFVAPSASIGRHFEALGLDPGKIRVSDYGFRPAPPLPRTPRQVATRRLRIGFVGTLVWHKGVHILVDAVRRLPSDAYEVLLYGDTDVFPDYVAELRRAATGLPVHFKGGFDTSAIGEIYRQFDVLVVPSLWLENSPLVIHEAFQAGVPVVGARMGGIADLVQDGINGALYDADSPDSLSGVLAAILATPACLDDWMRRLPAVKSIADDALEWENTYVRVIDARRVVQLA
jgi:glycosyltransferase involved in cell wall biosynthesis